jgi:hypothetical protein
LAENDVFTEGYIIKIYGEKGCKSRRDGIVVGKDSRSIAIKSRRDGIMVVVATGFWILTD